MICTFMRSFTGSCGMRCTNCTISYRVCETGTYTICSSGLLQYSLRSFHDLHLTLWNGQVNDLLLRAMHRLQWYDLHDFHELLMSLKH